VASKDKNPAKKKKFLALPRYPGGSRAFRFFLMDNQVYPEEAMAKGIEGDVYVRFRVNDLGEVIEAHVEKGIGHGCDEEALRIVRLLKYEQVRNRGMRVESSMRTKIPFRLNKDQDSFRIVYNSSVAGSEANPEDRSPQEKNVYSYTIRFEHETPGGKPEN